MERIAIKAMEKHKKELDLLGLLKVVWGNKKKLLIWGLVFMVAGLVVAFSIPRRYTSTIKIAIEGSNQGLNSSMSAIAGLVGVTSGVSKQENGINEKLYPQILKSTPFLMEFANLKVDNNNDSIPLWEYLTKHQKRSWWNYIPKLPSTITSWFSSHSPDTNNVYNSISTQAHYVGIFGSCIVAGNDLATGVFSINVSMQNPEIAKIIAQMLPNKLQKYVNDYRTSKTRENLASNTKMMNEARQEYYLIDSVYAYTADKNQNLISKAALIKLDRMKNERDLAYQIYQQLAIQTESDKIKLQEETTVYTTLEPASTPFTHSSPNRLLIIVGFFILGTLAYTTKTLLKQIL